MSPLHHIEQVRDDLKFRARKLRRDAEILIAKAEALEVAEVDLDIAIGKTTRAEAAA